MTDCCVKHLNYAGWLEFREWDEYFGAEVVVLHLVHYVCDICMSGYFLTTKAFLALEEV